MHFKYTWVYIFCIWIAVRTEKKNKEQLPLCISPFLVKGTNSPKEFAIHVSGKLSFGGQTVIVYSYFNKARIWEKCMLIGELEFHIWLIFVWVKTWLVEWKFHRRILKQWCTCVSHWINDQIYSNQEYKVTVTEYQAPKPWVVASRTTEGPSEREKPCWYPIRQLASKG